MNKRPRIVFLSILLLSLALGTAQAQRILGAVWDLPADESQAVHQLQRFQELGVTVLQLQQLPPDHIWSEINRRNFSVHGDLGIMFPTTHTFAGADSIFSNRVHKRIAGFAAQPAVEALNLFTHGAVHKDAFTKASTTFFSRFRPLRSIQTYYTDSRERPHPDLPADYFMYDIRAASQNMQTLSIPDSSNDNIKGYRYIPAPEHRELLTPLQRIVRETDDRPHTPLFLDGAWLLSMVDKHPQLTMAIQLLSSEPDPVLPTPVEPRPSHGQSPLPIIVLLVVWAMLAFHYNMSPLYRKSLFRYFTGHKFFLGDIFRQHIRSPFPAIIIIIQNALLSGAVLFTVFTRFFSEMGVQSLRYHLPGLFFITGSEYDIFIVVFGATLAFSLIGILWLYLSHKSLRSITQIMIIYAWPLQVNIFFGTLAIAIHASGGTPAATAILAGFVLAVCLGSFIIAVRDAAQYLTRKRLKYISFTAGLYLIFLVGLTIWLLEFNSPLWQIVDLGMELK